MTLSSREMVRADPRGHRGDQGQDGRSGENGDV